MHGTPSSKINLALKSKLVCEDEQSQEEEEEDDDENGDEIKSDEGPSYEDMALFVKKFSAGKFKGRFQKKKVRKCYNCEETNHFSNECFYCKGTGHWKRNCPKYLADKKDGKVNKGICDIHDIDEIGRAHV